MGMSFTGSTLTSTMFNCVPGVIGLGEVHWLLRKPRSGCNVCGPGCSVISKLDRKNLSWGNITDKLLEASGKNILVTSDKDSSFVEPMMEKKGFDTIIMFKRPEAFAASGIRHENIWQPAKLSEAFPRWYKRLQAWSKEWSRKTVVLEYESLVTNVNKIFPLLCEALELPKPKTPIVYPPHPNHNVMGNVTAFMGNRYKQKPIRLDDRWRMELKPWIIKKIQADVDCQYVWRQLRKKSIGYKGE
jgi:hypothetical protein